MKIYLILGFIFLLLGGVLTFFITLLYFVELDLQEKYPEQLTIPGSNRPYPGYDLLSFAIPIILSFILGSFFILFYKLKNNKNYP